jgi:hypothetical protein
VRRTVLLGVVALAAVACSDPGPGTVHPYDRSPVPAVPDRTQVVDLGIASGVDDGEYWAVLTHATPRSGSFDPVLTFELQQAEFDADGGVKVTEEPSRTVKAWPATVTVLTVVSAERQNYAVPMDELASLASGAAPSADAPVDYAYVDYPFLVTIMDGDVVEVHQVWLDETASG